MSRTVPHDEQTHRYVYVTPRNRVVALDDFIKLLEPRVNRYQAVFDAEVAAGRHDRAAVAMARVQCWAAALRDARGNREHFEALEAAERQRRDQTP